MACCSYFSLPRSVTLGIVLMGAMAAMALRLHLFLSGEVGSATYSLPARADGLLIGASVALIACWGWFPQSTKSQRALTWMGGVSALILAAMLLLVTSVGKSLFLGTYALTCLATGTLIAGLINSPPAVLRRILSWRPLVWIGRISYGLYLYHVPVYCLTPSPSALASPYWSVSVAIIFAFGASFAIASASFYLVEKRFLALKRYLHSRKRPHAEREAILVPSIAA